MEQKTIFEQLGGTYSQQGDYMLPNLTLPDTKEYVIGKYGHMRQRYLAPKSHLARYKGICDWQVRTYAAKVSQKAPPDSLHKLADLLQAVRAFSRY